MHPDPQHVFPVISLPQLPILMPIYQHQGSQTTCHLQPDSDHISVAANHAVLLDISFRYLHAIYLTDLQIHVTHMRVLATDAGDTAFINM